MEFRKALATLCSCMALHMHKRTRPRWWSRSGKKFATIMAKRKRCPFMCHIHRIISQARWANAQLELTPFSMNSTILCVKCNIHLAHVCVWWVCKCCEVSTKSDNKEPNGLFRKQFTCGLSPAECEETTDVPKSLHPCYNRVFGYCSSWSLNHTIMVSTFNVPRYYVSSFARMILLRCVTSLRYKGCHAQVRLPFNGCDDTHPHLHHSYDRTNPIHVTKNAFT